MRDPKFHKNCAPFDPIKFAGGIGHSMLYLKKNNAGVAHYNFNAHQPILVIFGRDVTETVCYQMVIC